MTERLDLLLVNAPSRTGVYQELSRFAAIEPPVWAGLLARALLNAGWRVDILDAEALGLSTAGTAAEIQKRSPRLAAFCVYGHQPSASTQCMPGAIEVVGWLKDRRSAVRTAALGTHPSALPERTLYDGFDYVCRGEGLYTLPSMLVALRHGGNPGKYPAHLRPPGMTNFSHGFGSLPISSGNAPLVQNLDEELPEQAFELLPMKKYRPFYWHQWTGRLEHRHDQGGNYSVPAGGYASVQTSLGCPFKCSFCCINAPFGGPGYRMWGAENVVAQIAKLVADYGITNIKIPDEMFVLNRAHVMRICELLIARGLGKILNMWAYARIDTVRDEALLERMREAGFRWLGIGIESASKHVRDGVEKGRFGNEEILAACARVRRHGLHIGANYIFGLPDDTHESMNETLDLALEVNGEHSNFYCAMAYPGSALHAEAKKRGWKLPEDTSAGWIGYSQHAYESLPLRTETLSSEEVLDFRDSAWLHYHQRPEYLAMLRLRFGPHAEQSMKDIIALGKPRRKHRDPDPFYESLRGLEPI